LLPCFSPASVAAAGNGADPLPCPAPQTLIRMISAWAFLPASPVLRGDATSRSADMIRNRRRRKSIGPAEGHTVA
jgi:hypothetical protein